jgi:hypothetical protein
VRLRSIDLTLEGDAHRVTDPATLERVVEPHGATRWDFAH